MTKIAISLIAIPTVGTMIANLYINVQIALDLVAGAL